MNSEDSIPTANAETSEARASDRDDIRREVIVRSVKVDLFDGIEPLFDMKTTATLIPISFTGLEKILHKYKAIFPARYRKAMRSNGTLGKQRLISRAEILKIRDLILSGPGKHKLIPD